MLCHDGRYGCVRGRKIDGAFTTQQGRSELDARFSRSLHSAPGHPLFSGREPPRERSVIDTSNLMVGVSGVRGRVGEGLTPEVIAHFAAAFGAYALRNGPGKTV